MKTLYLDTEFNGHGGELISIALVSACGKEFYAEVLFWRNVEPWVQENVLPKLTGPKIDYPTLKGKLHAFLSQFDGGVMVVADWYADFVHFFELFEGPDFRSSLDIPVWAVLKSGPSDIRPETPHNALSDARALRDYWEERPA